MPTAHLLTSRRRGGGKVAEALGAEKLILLTDVEGVKSRDGALIDTLPRTRRPTYPRRHDRPAG